MDVNLMKDTIVKVLQLALSPNKNLSPQYIADAIIFELNYAKNSKDMMKDELKGQLQVTVDALEVEANLDMNQLNEDEKLLRNFVHGKLEAYKEIKDLIEQA